MSRVIFSLGVMTGTSCDGADLALLRMAQSGGVWKEKLQSTASRRFPEELRQRLREAQLGNLSIADTARLTRDYSLWLATYLDAALTKWGTNRRAVCIAVHGQTVWHEPERLVSVQLLDPAIIAARTDCTTLAAFRQPDLARGGQGAPLVAYYHWLRSTSLPHFSRMLPFAIHNVGGIANLTYIAPRLRDVIAFDTGPGNALIDLASAQVSGGARLFDRGGAMARDALDSIEWRSIEALAGHPYFRMRPPKTTGRELFNESFLKLIPGAGAGKVANATALTAHTMARAYRDFIFSRRHELNTIFIAGGGARNSTLLELFSRELKRLSHRSVDVTVLPDAFAPPQFLESMAFARLGFEALQGKPISLSTVTGATEDAKGAGIFPASNFRRLLDLLDMI